MATIYWVGNADAVAQVHTASIDTVDATPANNTFTVTIGGQAISAVGDTDVATTATNLRASLNASTHPYFATITWSGTSGDIIGTADVAGVPFIAALTETGAGSATVTDFAETTANAGPNSLGTAANWSGGALPVAADEVYLKDESTPIAYDLEKLTAVTVALLRADLSQTGKVGLLPSQFATEVDGTSLEATAIGATTTPEYRATYLEIGWDRAEIGQHFGPGNPSGAARMNLKNTKSGASDTIVYGTHSNGESNRPAVLLTAAHASADLFVRSARGAVGVGASVPGETATFGDIVITTTTSSHKTFIEEGVTLTSFQQDGGTNFLKSAGTVTSADINGGTASFEGDQKVTTVTVNGGTLYPNNVPSAGNCIDTLNLKGGKTDFNQSQRARTVGTTTPTTGGGAELIADDHVTFTTVNLPSGQFEVEFA